MANQLYKKLYRKIRLYDEIVIVRHIGPDPDAISSQIALNVQHPYAMMDSSDGLFDCLYQISQKSKVRIDIDYSKIPHETSNRDFVLYGGEDYSLVVALSKEDFNKIKGLTQIGIVSCGGGVYIDNTLYSYKSYPHFN